MQAGSLLYNYKHSVVLDCMGTLYMVVSTHGAWDEKTGFGGHGTLECPYTSVAL